MLTGIDTNLSIPIPSPKLIESHFLELRLEGSFAEMHPHIPIAKYFYMILLARVNLKYSFLDFNIVHKNEVRQFV